MARHGEKPKRSSLPPHAPLDELQLIAVAGLFATLSEPSRLGILQVLHGEPISVTQVVERTGLKQANASKQLRILHAAGVIDRRQEGNRAVYSIAMPLVFKLCELVCNGVAKQAADYAAELSR